MNNKASKIVRHVFKRNSRPTLAYIKNATNASKFCIMFHSIKPDDVGKVKNLYSPNENTLDLTDQCYVKNKTKILTY